MSFHFSLLTSWRKCALIIIMKPYSPPGSGNDDRAVSSPLLVCQYGAHCEELDWKIYESKKNCRPLSSRSTQSHTVKYRWRKHWHEAGYCFSLISVSTAKSNEHLLKGLFPFERKKDFPLISSFTKKGSYSTGETTISCRKFTSKSPNFKTSS